MEGLSFWSVQALQDLGIDSPVKVKYCQSREEVVQMFVEGKYGTTLSNPLATKHHDEEIHFTGDPRTYSTNPNPKPQVPEHDPKGDAKRDYPSPNSIPLHVYHQFIPKYNSKIEDLVSKAIPDWRKYSFGDVLNYIHDECKNLKGVILSFETFLRKLIESPTLKQSVLPETKHDNSKEATNSYGSLESEEVSAGLRRYQYALVYGETTEFNPSGIWVVEEFYNNNDT